MRWLLAMRRFVTASLVTSSSAVCVGDVVLLSFDLSNRINDNFAGRDATSEAAGLPQNIRITNVAIVNGESIDLVLDSPDGAVSQCTYENTCGFGINSDGVVSWKVASNLANAYNVRWSFEYTDGSGTATLQRLAITWRVAPSMRMHVHMPCLCTGESHHPHARAWPCLWPGLTWVAKSL